MCKKYIGFQIVLIYLLIFSSYYPLKVTAFNNHIDRNSEVIQSKISKEDVVKLIKEHGKESNYYLEHLSFQLINVDNDDDLEIIAHTFGGVHLGYFFLFDKDVSGKYLLAAERFWKVEKLSFDSFPNLLGGIKLHELTELSGGSDLSILTAHLWYMKDGKFIEAWKGKLKEESVFQDNYALTVGGYQYIQTFSHLYTWSSNYLINTNTNIPKEKPTTTVSIYKFDGNKFILESEGKCEHSKVLPNMQ